MTLAIPRRARHPFVAFLGIALAVYAMALVVVANLQQLEQPSLVSTGIILDLVLTVPLVWYFVVVRRTRVPEGSLLPVVVVSFLLASRIVPEEHHRTLDILEIALAPLELAILGWIGWRVARALRRPGGHADPLERFREKGREITGHDRLGEVLASELALFHYAFGAWRAEPHLPGGASAFTHHERSGHGGIVVAFLVLLAVEGIAVHFLLMHWNALVAWIFTVSTVYAALWLLADYRATVLRPILVDDEGVEIRAGLRQSLRAPRSLVLETTRRDPGLGREMLKLSFPGPPTLWIVFREPVTAEGMYGIRRRVRAVGLDPDDPGALEAALAARS